MSNLKQGPVVAFGELLWDILPTGPVLGGAPANFAFRLATLGVDSYLVSRVGTDPLGDEALRMLGESGVDTRFVQRDSRHPTGTVNVFLDHSGNATYEILRDVAYDHVENSEALEALCGDASMICFGALIQRSEVSRATLHRVLQSSAALKLVDINLRRDCWNEGIVRSSLEIADILKLNDDETAKLAPVLRISDNDPMTFARAVVSSFNLRACLVTRAERGVVAVSSAGEEVDLPGIPVEVVDTIGSGDAFTAGFARALLRGESLESACRAGNELGAEVATTRGGMSHLPA